MNEKKTPAIRFQGFTDDWEQRKLGEVADVYDGVHQTPIYQDSGIMFLSVENISTLTSNKFISEEAFERDYKNYPEKGDILMTRIGDVGTPNVVETAEKVAFYVSLALLKPKDTDSFFLCNTIRSTGFQKGLRNRTLVTAIPQKINKDEIGKVEFQMPTNPDEPKKIGIYFKILDHLITLHQRKLTKLQLLKKSMLTKMFPKDGARVPEIRFQGFHGDWKQRKLGEVLKFQNGFNGGREIYGDGIAFISVMDILNNQFITYNCIRGKVTVTDDEKERFSVRYGDVLFQRSSETFDDAGKSNVYVDTKDAAIFGGFVIRGRQIAPYNPKFMKYLLDTRAVRHQVTRKAQGAQHVNVSQETLQDIQILLPSQKEQEYIEEYLCKLENLIAFQQRKLSKLQQIKQAMLSKLFV